MSDSVGKTVAKRGFGAIVSSLCSGFGDVLMQAITPKESKPSKTQNLIATDFEIKLEGLVNRLQQMDMASIAVRKETGETKVQFADPRLEFVLTGNKSVLRKETKDE